MRPNFSVADCAPLRCAIARILGTVAHFRLPWAFPGDCSALVTLTLSVASIFGRRKSREPAKCLREGTRFAKANLDTDLCHRELRHLQQAPGAIHPVGHMVTMRRHAEGLREGARKMIKAQIDESGQ